jgi:hypothetical protein
MSGRPLALVVLVALLGGCESSRSAPGASASASASAAAEVVVDQAAIAIKTGPVGAGETPATATYALVPAKNRGARDLVVTLGGALEASGARYALLPETLRVPAGGERLFALVDAGQGARDDAGARVVVEVTGAQPVDFAPPVKVNDGRVTPDQGRAVVAAEIENTAALEAKVPVIAAFYGADRKPMARPFTVVVLAAGGKRGIQLVGPVGSTDAQLYLGEVQY